MERYVFTAEGEVERLRIQARVWEPAAKRLLDRIGVRRGARCVDLGCGPVGILGPLARRAGPTGQVIGVDLMSEGIAAARALARAEGLTGVSIVEADAYATELPRASFDLVHARFLAAPLGRPEALVREMIALCRPGGVVVLEEPDQASWGYVPTPRVWPRVKEVFEAVFPRFGGDANAGRSVYGLLRRQGLEDVHVDAAVVALQGGHPYMQTPVHGLAAMRRHIVDAALMTDREVDEAIDELGRAAGDPGVHSTTFMLVQTWGRRPAALSKPRAVQREVKNADHGP